MEWIGKRIKFSACNQRQIVEIVEFTVFEMLCMSVIFRKVGLVDNAKHVIFIRLVILLHSCKGSINCRRLHMVGLFDLRQKWFVEQTFDVVYLNSL